MKPVLLNDFKTQWKQVKTQFLQAVERVGESGYLILGPEVKSFEEELAKFWGLKYAVGCANGLDAIEIGLRVLGIQPGQKVLTTPLSAFATTLAILKAGGIPVFCDTDKSGLINLDIAEDYFKQNKDVKLFLPVHLYGQSLNLKHLKKLKDQFNLLIIEDCAQSIAANSDGQMCGDVGQLAATSFYPTKNLGCYGDGGALLTNLDDINELSRSLRDYGQSEKYVHSYLGLNSRLDELQAAVLRSALLPNLNKWTESRKSIASVYLENINNSQIELPKIPHNNYPVWHLFPIKVKDKNKRQSFINFLKENGIQTGIHYPILIPDQPLFKQQKNLNYEIFGTLNEAKSLCETEVSLPIHPFLTKDELDKVISVCNAW